MLKVGSYIFSLLLQLSDRQDLGEIHQVVEWILLQSQALSQLS